MLLGGRNIGERMFNVTAALRTINRRSREGDDLLQEFKSFIQSHTASGGNIENLARHLPRRSTAGQKISLHCIVDVRKIAALFTIAKDGGPFSAQHLGDESGQ